MRWNHSIAHAGASQPIICEGEVSVDMLRRSCPRRKRRKPTYLSETGSLAEAVRCQVLPVRSVLALACIVLRLSFVPAFPLLRMRSMRMVLLLLLLLLLLMVHLLELLLLLLLLKVMHLLLLQSPRLLLEVRLLLLLHVVDV